MEKITGFQENGFYDDDYDAVYLEGKDDGYAEGYADCSYIYEGRLAHMWGEIQTLNARVSYLEKLMTERGM